MTEATSMARHLRVSVLRDGRPVVNLTMPATATENLADLMPGHLVEQMRQQAVDVARIGADAVARGLTPGNLFHHVDGGKDVRVWLE